VRRARPAVARGPASDRRHCGGVLALEREQFERLGFSPQGQRRDGARGDRRGQAVEALEQRNTAAAVRADLQSSSATELEQAAGSMHSHLAACSAELEAAAAGAETAQAAVDIANNGGLALTTSITVRAVAGEEFERIVGAEVEPLPEYVPAWDQEEFDPALAPF